MSPLWPISLCKVIGDGRRLFRPLFYTINIPGRKRKRSAAIPCQTNIQTIQKGKPAGLPSLIFDLQFDFCLLYDSCIARLFRFFGADKAAADDGSGDDERDRRIDDIRRQVSADEVDAVPHV